MSHSVVYVRDVGRNVWTTIDLDRLTNASSIKLATLIRNPKFSMRVLTAAEQTAEVSANMQAIRPFLGVYLTQQVAKIIEVSTAVFVLIVGLIQIRANL